mmetsp:Transcript_138100/g.429264  ORF Transcript_138100/g.429264 Transcript_138100/m.429264 type:complete len:340 (-) Transcript_138100:859-1878(-)
MCKHERLAPSMRHTRRSAALAGLRARGPAESHSSPPIAAAAALPVPVSVVSVPVLVSAPPVAVFTPVPVTVSISVTVSFLVPTLVVVARLWLHRGEQRVLIREARTCAVREGCQHGRLAGVRELVLHGGETGANLGPESFIIRRHGRRHMGQLCQLVRGHRGKVRVGPPEVHYLLQGSVGRAERHEPLRQQQQLRERDFVRPLRSLRRNVLQKLLARGNLAEGQRHLDQLHVGHALHLRKQRLSRPPVKLLHTLAVSASLGLGQGEQQLCNVIHAPCCQRGRGSRRHHTKDTVGQHGGLGRRRGNPEKRLWGKRLELGHWQLAEQRAACLHIVAFTLLP